HVGENRPFQESELPLVGGGVVVNDFGAGDVARHQVGSELDTFKGEVQRLGKGGNQQRFGQTGNSNQKRMAASQDRDEHLIDDGFLPDDNFAHFGFDSGAGALE